MMLMTANEAAESLGVSKMTIYRLIKDGKLKAWRVAGEGPIRMESEDVEALKVPVKPDELVDDRSWAVASKELREGQS